MKRSSPSLDPRTAAPDAPFAVPAPEHVALSQPAPAEEAPPGLTSWGSEAIRLLTAELGCVPVPPPPPGITEDPIR